METAGTNVPIGGTVDKALKAFRAGNPVLVHDFDDREGEIDLVYPALAVSPRDVAKMRNDAGGLICVAVSHEVSEAFDLPFLADELSHPASQNKELAYDERSSFSLPVNFTDTFTGITDNDRARTITELGRAAADPQSVDFASDFHTPGHVHILRAAPNLLSEREGHTELGITLAKAAGRAPAVVVCEMLDERTGRALSKVDARRYARRNGLPYIEGQSVAECVVTE
jgi:3,4-dihydroxy 2-butanone 4-phosphate synthase